MALATGSICDSADGQCATDVGRVVARIHGALGSAILVGLDRLTVCRCGAPPASGGTRRDPWSYSELETVEIDQYGSLPVVLLRLSDRSEPLPILLLERGQVGPALDGLVTLRRLIADAHPARSADLEPISILDNNHDRSAL